MGDRLSDMGLPPVLEGIEHAAVVIDGLQHLCQRHIVPFREQCAGRAGVIRPRCRGGNMEDAISACFQMGIDRGIGSSSGN